MGSPKNLKTLWPFSNTISLFVIIALPILGFLLSTQYQRFAHTENSRQKLAVPALHPTITHWKTFTNTAYGYTIQYPPDSNLQIESWDAYGSDQMTSKMVNFKYGFNEPAHFYSVGVDAGRGLNVDANQFSQWVRNDVDKTIQKNNAILPNLSKLGTFFETTVDIHPAIYVEFLSSRSQGKAGYAIYI